MTQLALNGGKPVFPPDHAWPQWPIGDESDEQRLLDALHQPNWGLDAPATAELTEKFAELLGVRYVLAVNSGTAALELIVKALDIGPGDEVIVPAYTFVASATCVLETGATVVFADVNPATSNLDLTDVERRLTSRTRAVIPVHFGGNPVDLLQLKRLLRGRKVAIIEDAAHAHGMVFRGKAPGHRSVAAEFSFQTSKNMTCGEGGILATNSKKLYEDAWSCHSFGRLPGHEWYEHFRLSWNHRISAFQSALLLGQLERLEEQTQVRARNAAILDSALRDIRGCRPQEADGKGPGTRRVHHLYAWRHVEKEAGISRDSLVTALQAEGVPCAAGYPTPLHRAPMFRNRRFWHAQRIHVQTPKTANEPDYRQDSMPGAEQLCREAVWLYQPLLLSSQDDMVRIAQAVKKVISAGHAC